MTNAPSIYSLQFLSDAFIWEFGQIWRVWMTPSFCTLWEKMHDFSLDGTLILCIVPKTSNGSCVSSAKPKSSFLIDRFSSCVTVIFMSICCVLIQAFKSQATLFIDLLGFLSVIGLLLLFSEVSSNFQLFFREKGETQI